MNDNGEIGVLIDHYMIAGQVAFLPAGDGAVPQAMALNTLVKLPENHPWNARAIGVAQQSLQMQVHRRVTAENQPPPKMLDVCILCIMPLGRFAEGEFEAGSTLAEQAEAGHVEQPN
jgi:hypothetical protein